MTPEELITRAKELAPKIARNPIYAAQASVCIGDLLEHIDEQAAQIEALKKLLIEKEAASYVLLDRWEDLAKWEKRGLRDDAKKNLVTKYPEAMK